MPERLIEADPEAYLRNVMVSRRAGMAPFDPRALAEHERCMALPGAAHSLCEDYRAAGIDLEHDRADRAAGHSLVMPLLVLWGELGIIERCFDALAEWRKVADDIQGPQPALRALHTRRSVAGPACRCASFPPGRARLVR